MVNQKAYLILENGSVFEGQSFGARGIKLSSLGKSERALGELVFNTGMSGYHEILTDPSYTGQMVVMTTAHVGNYGCDSLWSEGGLEPGDRKEVKLKAFVVKSYYDGPVPKGRISLDEFLKTNDIPGISGIDTRALTIMLRDEGNLNGIIIAPCDGLSFLSDSEIEGSVTFLKKLPSMEGQNLIENVGCDKPFFYKQNKLRLALIDCGVKKNIIIELTKRGVQVLLLPSTTSYDQIVDLDPHGVFFSNGPGDPSVLDHQVDLAKKILGNYPLLGICLGHQIIGQAIGAKTFKMKFGHHGCNHPVRDEKSGRVFVTSQNHGFALDETTLPKGAEVRFRNANDHSIEGIEWEDKNVLCVQFHPEAAPGPVDSTWIFDAFIKLIKGDA